jgi:hypothetical protein
MINTSKTLKQSVVLILIILLGLYTELKAQGRAIEVTQTIDFWSDCANEGAGEQLVGELTVNLVTHIKDGAFAGISASPKGGTVIGQSSGLVYRPTGATVWHFSINKKSFNETFVNRFQMVAPGGNIVYTLETFHVTVNANGEVTALVDYSVEGCK